MATEATKTGKTPSGKTPKALKYGFFATAVVAGVGTAIFAANARPPEGVIPEGVHVAGMDWSRKNIAMAREELEGWRKARMGEHLTLTLPAVTGVTRKWTPTRTDLGADVDTDTTMAEAAQSNEQKGFFARMSGWFAKPKMVELTPHWKLDKEKARKYLTKRVAPRVLRKEKDARFLATENSFKIVPEQPGTALDVEGSLAAITAELEKQDILPVELPVKTVTPHVTSNDLKGIEGEISRFRTHYAETGNRAKNIATASKHIDGVVLKPGDVFSYNKIVGPRDEDAGFRTAPVIISGRLQPGMGGGICQTSTTLYNAALLADLKIVQRSHHAFPVHYVPAGRDATVSYDDKDLKFQNNTDAPIAIAADGEGGQVFMRIFGKKVAGREVQLERTNVSSWGPETRTIHDNSLPIGKQVTEKGTGHAGHRVTLWRTVLMNGQQVKREVVSRDYYDSFARIVHVGTRPVASKPVTAPGTPAGASATDPGTTIPE